MSFIVWANKRMDTCVAEEIRLVSPSRYEYVDRKQLNLVFQCKRFKGMIRTSETRRSIILHKGKLKLGCCSFNSRETAKLRKWALA